MWDGVINNFGMEYFIGGSIAGCFLTRCNLHDPKSLQRYHNMVRTQPTNDMVKAVKENESKTKEHFLTMGKVTFDFHLRSSLCQSLLMMTTIYPYVCMLMIEKSMQSNR
jgi:hypothetical protein